MAEVQRSAGTVRWFSGQKGFGFIAPDDSGDDLFVHQTEIRAEGFRFLREGQRVDFVVDSAEDGRNKAVDVVGLGRSSYRSGDGGRGRGRRDFGGKGGGGYGRFEGRGGGGRTGGRYAAGVSGGGGGAECYNCGRVGHLARDCYQGGDGGRSRGGGRNRGYGGDGDGNRGGYGGGHGGGGGGGSSRACYNCGEDGHFARDCPNVQN